jgi:hypothetical protein
MLKEKNIKYRRLPGRNFTRYSLWLAKDHILNLKSREFSEEYKRFYFQDIQAIITRETTTGKVLSIIFGVLAGLFGLAAYRSTGNGAVTLWIFSGIFLLVLFINYLLGPTCTCQIMTGVQYCKLPSLSRLRTAEKVLEILNRAIQRTQGKLIDTRVVQGDFRNLADSGNLYEKNIR